MRTKQERASMALMGLGQIMYGQYAKGILYLCVLLGAITYFAAYGVEAIIGFFTLGTTKGDAWAGIEGDNSVIMLLMGIFTFILLGLFIACYIHNLKDVKRSTALLRQGEKLTTFRQDLRSLLDKNFHVSVLFLPIIGVLIFNIIPIVFMILIAFTNYGGDIVPPELVDWTGIESFEKILALSKFAPTFFKILGWNLVWALVSTFLNYFLGLFLSLLLNKECVKGKAIWRAFPILAYAIPGFITLIGFRFMFSYGGPINQIIKDLGSSPIGFLDIDAKWMARAIGICVNAWITVPSVMLLCTGILSNLDKTLFEAAKIDGAGRWKQFKHITLPFMLFSTTPVIIGQFIGNFNNFGIFFFLRRGLHTDGYFLASDTDLLINWLYNLSIDNTYYSIGAAISLVIFVITSMISLVVYIKSPSYREEDTFR